MTSSDFDREENFDGLLSRKWNLKGALSTHQDLLPLWVADMDFQTAPAIRQALTACAQRGLYGYPTLTDRYTQAVVDWFGNRHGWQISPGSLVQTPGIMSAIHAIIGALSKEGEGVIVQSPTYPPFAKTVQKMNRTVLDNPLREHADRYSVDFEGLEHLASLKTTRLLILCNPQNPTGKVFSHDELANIASICSRHGVFVIADEVHCDIHFSEARHRPFQTVSNEAAQISAACTATSKTFNLAGLKNANIVIPNPDIRKKILNSCQFFGFSRPGLFPLVADEAAYREGASWQASCLDYLEANRDFALTFFAKHLPNIRLIKPQATYFLWLDFRPYNLTPERLERVLLDGAGLWLNQGHTFGDQGKGFARLNFACPRSRLKTALDRLKTTFACV